ERGGQHTTVECEADHHFSSYVSVASHAGRLTVVWLVQPEEQEEHNRHHDRDDDGAPVAGQAPNFEFQRREVEAAQRWYATSTQIGCDIRCHGAHELAPVLATVSSPVRARNASSMPRAVISRSFAAVCVSRYRATASLSFECTS